MKAVSWKGVAVLGLALVAASCSSRRVLVPPRVDLHAFGTIGLVRFSPQTFDGLSTRATAEFLSAIHAAQPGVRVLELGEEAPLLHTVASHALTRAGGSSLTRSTSMASARAVASSRPYSSDTNLASEYVVSSWAALFQRFGNSGCRPMGSCAASRSAISSNWPHRPSSGTSA